MGKQSNRKRQSLIADDSQTKTHGKRPWCLWDGRYPGESAISCQNCHRRDQCRDEMGITPYFDLDNEADDDFFKDIVCIQANYLLEEKYSTFVRGLTGTCIGNYYLPEELRTEATKLAIDRYHANFYDIVQAPYQFPRAVRRNAACIAAARAHLEFFKCVDNLINDHQQNILHAIATIALSVFEGSDEDYDEDDE